VSQNCLFFTASQFQGLTSGDGSVEPRAKTKLTEHPPAAGASTTASTEIAVGTATVKAAKVTAVNPVNFILNENRERLSQE
jgi:hypothetical protein